MEEKWKHTRKEISSSSSSSSFTRSYSTKNSSNISPKGHQYPILKRSSSLKIFNNNNNNNNNNSSSSSSNSPTKISPSNLSRNISQKGSSIKHKYSSIAKEQKARFYIMRRCVAMLVCWHKHDS